MKNSGSKVYKTSLGRALILRTIIISFLYLLCLSLSTLFMFNKSNQLYKENQRLDQLTTQTQTLIQALIDQETGQRGYDLTGDPSFLEPYNRGTKTYDSLATQLIQELKQQPTLDSPFKEMINKGYYWHTHYGSPQILVKRNRGNVTKPSLLEGKQHFDAFRTSAQSVLSKISYLKKRDFQHLTNLSFQFHLMMILLSVFLIIILVLHLFDTFQQITEPVFEIQQGVKELAKGNFDFSITIKQKLPGELDDLVNHLRMMRDQLQHLFKETQHEANTDGLTDIYNRGYFDEKLGQSIAQYHETGKTFSLIMFDVDQFKLFNDTYGHTEGDRLLRHIARTTESELSDTDLFARYGGEEFVILTLQENPLKLAEKVRRIIEVRGLGNYNVTISAGVSTVRAGDHPKKLIDRADQALYKAKQNGRNQVSKGLNVS